VKQVLQNLRDGATEIADVPCPAVRPGHLLIRTSRTLVSAGTERMLVGFGKANLIDKARQQPDKVRQVLDKARTDGLVPTLQAVRNKLDQPLALGYSNVGVVLEVGAGVPGFAPGDRVASNGKHAEVVNVPVNLCAKVPDRVSDDEAAFTVIGAIALQGVRLVQPTLGEAVVVIGLGLIGLMTVQLLRSHGCRVLATDFDPARLELARRFGAEAVDLSTGMDPLVAANGFSRGRSVDAVIITASTQSSEPVHQAALMCRKRGRIVLVGVTGLELSRADFFEKELTFQVSCSYGPGRYDPNYEEEGQDYPLGFVRWTEQRNFEAILDMMADKRLDTTSLISHRFSIDQAEAAYVVVSGSAPSLGIMFEYPGSDERPRSALLEQTVRIAAPRPREGAGARMAFIGPGNYATGMLIPAFRAAGAQFKSVVSSGGVNGLHAGRKFGFETTTTDVARIFADENIDAVAITTRNDSHARFVLAAIGAGKHVFVEKPLCLTLEELAAIEAAWLAKAKTGTAPILMVGFNRRFAPQTQRIKELLASVLEPMSFIMTVNAAAVPPEHWTRDPKMSGGRVIGEACHFIDLLRYLAGSPITTFKRFGVTSPTDDTASLQLTFADGSIGTIHYFGNGNRRFPKERLEVFSAGRILQLDNFSGLAGFGWRGFRKMNLWRQDKGQTACAKAFVAAITQGEPPPIPIEELLEVSRVSIALAQQ